MSALRNRRLALINPSPPAAPMTEELLAHIVAVDQLEEFNSMSSEDLRVALYHRRLLIREVTRLRTEAAQAKADQALALIQGIDLGCRHCFCYEGGTTPCQRCEEIGALRRQANALHKSQPPDAGAEGPE